MNFLSPVEGRLLLAEVQRVEAVVARETEDASTANK